MKYSQRLISYITKYTLDQQITRDDLIAKVFEIEHGDVIRKLPDELVIWYVKSCEKHTDANKLFVCQVDCWQKGEYQIITGWENISSDMYVAVALPWCYLSAIDLEIGARKMRGIDSVGMICSKWELGIAEDEDQHWIWDLDNDLDCKPEMIGMKLGEAFPYLEDRVWEVENVAITNRPDLTGHIWLAYELATIYGRDFISPANTSYQNLPSSSIQIKSTTDKLLDYTLFEIKDVEVKRSDFVTRLHLIDLDHTTFHNWVDFSNLFMELTSQPIHIFDADKVVGNIHVREANDGEEFLDLTWVKHALASWDILICDDEKIIALGGVMWWQSSMVHDTTKNIIIEIANFDPIQIRKTAKRLWLRTDAVVRFEKNIPVAWTRKCVDILYFILRDRDYLMDLGGMEIIWWNNHQPINLQDQVIVLDIKRLEKFLYGKEESGDKSVYLNILHRLGYKTTPLNQFEDDEYKVYPPVHRSDISNIQDIYEDLARHVWFENIPDIRLIPISKELYINDVFKLQKDISSQMIQWAKYSQVETYPRYGEETIETFGLDKSKHFVLTNPTSAPEPYLRHMIFPWLLSIISKNYRISLPIKVFEFGNVYIRWSDKYQEDRLETSNFCMIYADVHHQDWKEDGFLISKGVVQNILSDISDNITFVPSTYPYLHPKKQYNIMLGDTQIWFGGTVHPIIVEESNIDPALDVWVVEIDLSLLSLHAKKSDIFVDYKTNQDQILYRDLAFLVDTSHDFGSIKKAILSVEKVSDMEVFDVFRIDADTKSIGIKIKIIWDGDLKTDDINEIMKQVVVSVEKTWAKLRGQMWDNPEQIPVSLS